MRVRVGVALVVVLGLVAASCGQSDGDETRLSRLTPTVEAIEPLLEVAEVAPILDFLGGLGRLHSAPVKVLIGPDGGSLVLGDASTIEAPAGAFPEPTELGIVIVDVLFDEFFDDPPESTIYVLSTSEDVTLETPLILERPEPAADVLVEEFVDGAWRVVAVPEGPTTRIPFDHFSSQTRWFTTSSEGPPVPRRDTDVARLEVCESLLRDMTELVTGTSAARGALLFLIATGCFEAGEAGASDYRDCATDLQLDGVGVHETVKRCSALLGDGAPIEGRQPDEPASDLDAGADESAENTSDVTPPADGDSGWRVFEGEGTHWFEYYEVGVPTKNCGPTLELEDMPKVYTRVTLDPDGTATLFFDKSPRTAPDPSVEPPAPTVIECSFLEGAVAYEGTWIGVGSAAEALIPFGFTGFSIRVDVRPGAEGNPATASASELLIVEEGLRGHIIDFTLEEVS